MTQITNLDAWYEKTWVVTLLCIFFFPVGLYALWKNSSIAKGWKIGVTTIIGFLVFANFAGKKIDAESKKEAIAAVEKSAPEIQEEPAPVEKPSEPVKAAESGERDQIIQKLKAQAQMDYPDDYSTQEYWVREEIEAYDYMQKIENNSIKAKAEAEFPLDFSTQKYWYNEQVAAKERLK